MVKLRKQNLGDDEVTPCSIYQFQKIEMILETLNGKV